MAQVQGANNNHNSPVLFQTSGNRIDGGSGLLYNPAEDALKVNGNNITSQVFRGSGGEARLTCANHSSTNYVKVTNTTDIYGGGTLHGTWNGVGKVLQVLQTTRQDVWSESVGMGSKSGAALSQAITLTSNSNKVLINIDANFSASGCRINPVLIRNSSDIQFGVSNEGLIDYGLFRDGNNSFRFSFMYLDSPSSTSSLTYNLFFSRHGGSGTATFNKAQDSGQKSISTITLMEVSA